MIEKIKRYLKNSIKLLVLSCLIFLPDLSNNPNANIVEQWHSVKDTSLIIKEGSPLDFSKWILPGPAGKYGRVLINNSGKLYFEESKQISRFTCAALAWSVVTGGFPNHTQAEIYAKQLRIHGYNLVRFHYVDALLMEKRDKDFDFDPIQLDNWLYFLAALKREGIYWVMDSLTSVNGAIGAVYPNRYTPKYNLKQRVYFDTYAQEHWKHLTQKILTLHNPYTNMKIIDDPALVGVISVNEGGINYLATIAKAWPAGLSELFNQWLLKRYATTPDLQRSWGDLTSKESLELQTIKLPKSLREYTARMVDFQKFISETEIQTSQWMKQYIKDLGFKGLVTQYNNWPSIQMDSVRSQLEWIDMHSYHDEVFSFTPGSTINQNSSLGDMGRYVRRLAVTRQINKPFSVTEYGQPFWNRYRFEAGLMVSAMAGLQDWDFTCIHAEGAIDLTLNQTVSRKAAIHPYGIGIDPIARASETLATLIQLRGDIRSANHSIVVNVSGKRIFENAGIDEVGEDISKLSWLTRLYKNADIIPMQAPAHLIKNSIIMEPVRDGTTPIERLINLVFDTEHTRLKTYINKLREMEILSSDNLTNINAGILQSETKEIILNQNKRSFKIITPKTEAVTSATQNWHESLNILSINQMNVEGLVAITTLDHQPLINSKKILLIFATDAQNTNMIFMGKHRKQLVALGTMPPQIKHGIAKLSLKLNSSQKFNLYRLYLNGEKGEKISISQASNEISIVLDNFSIKQGPTTFFVLES